MRIILAQPRGSAPASNGRSRSSSARSRNTARRSMCGMRSCTTAMSSSGCSAKGARFVEELDEVPPGAVTIFSAHGVASEIERRGRRARPAGHRRDLPAGLQGAYRGPALCQPGARDHPDRPCRPSRGRGHDGPDRRPGAPGLAAPRRSPACAVADRTSVAFITQTTLCVDDTRAVIEALKAPLPDDRRAGYARTSATPRRTASARRASWPRSSMWSWSSARRTARTRTGCARSGREAGCRAI